MNKKIINVEIPLPKDVLEIAKAYNDANIKLYVVGGAIRDFLKGKTPHDYDLTTNALPEESKKILKNFNVSDEQGKNFAVLRVYTNDTSEGYEIASFRKDISYGRDTKGNEQKVEIGKNITIEDDCKRRDLTINAIFYDINKKQIVDIVGGVDDLKNNIIKTVGNPSERFSEDRLRILRCFRFAARTNGVIESNTSNIIKNDNRLRNINPKEDVSQERIHEEWNKVIEHAEKGGIQIMQKYINLLTEYNMWGQMFPKMNINKNIEITKLNNAIIFYELFENELTNKVRKYMINVLKFNTDLVHKVEFLKLYELVVYGLNNFGVYKLAKKKNSYHITDDLMRSFMPGKFTESFIKYCNDGFVINGLDLIEKGFKGKDIEIEKERLELKRFNNYLK